MILHLHGWMESTTTVGVRRLAKMCRSRSILFIAYEMHGHGLSLEKNGVRRADNSRGKVEGMRGLVDDHNVEMAKIMLYRHQLPLVLTAHR